MVKKSNEKFGDYFERCKKKGFANDPADVGGATMCGVTLAAFQQFCLERYRTKPGVEDLKGITYNTWLLILKTKYWDKWQADKIRNQSLADILVDWVWASGKYGITRPQKLLGVTPDGIVGQKTLAALNGRSPISFFGAVRTDRIKYINEIIARRPLNAKFKNGWLARINDFKFEES